jgi:hypothetical protein
MLVAAFDCCEKDNDEHKKQREELYTSFDGNANGLISLNETGSGVLQRLSNLYGKEAMPLYKRYYRSFIRAFMDARDASPPSGRPDDAQFVCKSEFRLLLVYLRVYATWHEVFRLVDCARTRGGSKLNYLDVEVPDGVVAPLGVTPAPRAGGPVYSDARMEQYQLAPAAKPA